jgi:hypothetical protein
MAYERLIHLGGSHNAAVSSFDAELQAQTVAMQAETEMLGKGSGGALFDATSLLDAALSFAHAHDRHRADFHCDTELAELIEAWEERSVA